jgi:drug/metabolite transporter (DMT)-like permease
MPASALAFALSAAVFHAVWNLLLARARDVEAATAVALVTAVVVFAPVAAATWRSDTRVLPFVVASGLLELVYFALLAAAYRRAPLSVVYPVARGTSPVLVAALSVVAGASLGARQLAGVVLVATGVVLVRGLGAVRGRAVGLGLAVGCSIAAYTVVDKHGIPHASPIAYLELVMVIPSVVYVAAVARLKGAGAIRSAVSPAPAVAGVASFVAYALVLAALARASAASVAAVRETSVVFATALAGLVLHERVTGWRLAGACLVVGGVTVLAR